MAKYPYLFRNKHLFTTDEPLKVGASYQVDQYTFRILTANDDGTFTTHAGSEVAPAPVPTGPVPDTPRVDVNPKDAVGQKKAPLHLIPVAALAAEAGAFRDGVRKYGAANWRITGVQASIYIAAALRHISLWYDGGEDVASDSKVKHLGHARACLGIVLDAEACGTLTDDRPPAVPGLEAILAGLGA